MKSSERIRYTGPALIEISESSKLSSLKPASHESDPPGPDAPQPETAQESSRAVKEYTADDVLQFIRYAPAMDGEWNDATPQQLIAAASQWHHGASPDVRVAINVSPRQLFDIKFVDRIQELLARHSLPAQCIEIELTENLLQTGTNLAIKMTQDGGARAVVNQVNR